MKTFKQLRKNCKNTPIAENAPRLALVGDTATQFLAMALRGEAISRGYDLNLFEAEYNQVERQFMDPSSELYAFDADYVVLFQSTHKLGEHHAMLGESQQCALADERLNFIASICQNPQWLGKKILCMNYPEIEDTVFGSYANKVEASLTWQVRKLNYGLMQLAQQHPNLFVCDIAGVQNKIGRDRMFAPNVYVSTEMVLSVDALPMVASRTIDIVSAMRGQFKKCLILDLDNTLWGGVIGDDGIEGIQLGHGLGIGKAFTEFQMWVKKLKQRGVIICVASKNNEETAKEPFEKHPEMVLRLEDISMFVANWEDKASNIKYIQETINIGMDSIVFIDDIDGRIIPVVKNKAWNVEYMLEDADKKPLLADLSVRDFAQETSRESPAPGGGTIAAYMGALGAALGTMVANLSSHKAGWDDRCREFAVWADKGQVLISELLHLVDEDTEAFNRIMAAFGMPKKTEEEKALRSKAIQDATLYAAQVPLRTMKASFAAFEICRAMAETGNPNSVSDAGVGALAARAAVLGAGLNVKINASSLKDRAVADALVNEAEQLMTKADAEEKAILEVVESVIKA